VDKLDLEPDVLCYSFKESQRGKWKFLSRKRRDDILTKNDSGIKNNYEMARGA